MDVVGSSARDGARLGRLVHVVVLPRRHPQRAPRPDRHVWQQAARLVGRRLLGPAVAYVVHKQAEDHGRPVWQAIEIREEG
ncbi:MAG TPA: hypothetical protein VF070_06490 [Streptosporangiaceae bacterium]